MAIFFVSSCQKEEHYESKNLPVKSVFDDISTDEESDEKIVEEANEKEENQVIEESLDSSKEDEKVDEGEEIEINQAVNIRSTPEFGDNIVETLEPNTRVKILNRNIGEDGQWAEIEYNDQIYYIAMEFI